jgi:hypothetical protein
MQPHRFGATDGLSHEALQSGPEREVFPFNRLRLSFANSMVLWIEVTVVHVCTIGIEMVKAQRCQQCLSRSEDFILMCPQDLRSADARLMINGMPEPSL